MNTNIAYYAVRVGRNPGIYTDWKDCKKEVIGMKGAVYRKFDNEEDAKAFINTELNTLSLDDLKKLPAFAFVDGSYNSKDKKVGAGGFIIVNDENGNIKDRYTMYRSVECDDDMLTMRNIAGEISASQLIIKAAIDAKIKDLTIIYDYQGIENWAKGLWKTNKSGTKEYQKYCLSVKDKINLHFIKVEGHTDITGNEIADRLAKFGSGNITSDELIKDITELNKDEFINIDALKLLLFDLDSE